MKKIGFLSFGHWTPAPYSDVRTASDALLQSIDLAVAAEELGLFFRFSPEAYAVGIDIHPSDLHRHSSPTLSSRADNRINSR